MGGALLATFDCGYLNSRLQGDYAMLSKFKLGLAAVALTFGVAGAPALAQQAGLVNVAIGDITTGDIISNNRVGVGVAANVAATVCGVTAQVGVIASQIARTGGYECKSATNGRFVQITR
jgi:hypothetical protein